MRNVLFAFALFISSLSSTFSQITFERNYDTLGFYYANCVRQTLDGGYVFCGSSYNSSSAQDAEIVKTDEYGNVMWAKKYGGPNTDGAIAIEVTADSNYFVFGLKDFVNVSQSDIWILKLDANGDTIFTKIIELGSGTNFIRGSTKTFDGGFALTGYTDTRGQGFNDVSLIKLTSSGDTSWIKTYGGLDNDNGYSVSQNSDSGFIISGRTGSFNVQMEDMYIIRTNVTGDTLWTRTFGFSNVDFAASAKQTPDGGFVLAGTSWDTTVGNYDIYLLKFDPLGTLIWDKRLPRGIENFASGLEILSDGKIIISGTILGAGNMYDSYLIVTDSFGDTLWTRTFGLPNHSEQTYSLSLTSDGGFILAGSSDDIVGVAYLLKTDSIGNLINLVKNISANPTFIVYPNPTSEIIQIKNISELDYHHLNYKIFNLFGKEVRFGNLQSITNEIDLTGLIPEIYLLKIFSEKSTLQTIKIILTQ